MPKQIVLYLVFLNKPTVLITVMIVCRFVNLTLLRVNERDGEGERGGGRDVGREGGR